MTEIWRVLSLARNDFSYFFRTKWLMAVLLSLNLSDMLVVALVYNKLMNFDYFRFFVPAVVVMGLFVAALDTGRRIWLAIREGVIHYYLSLPISTQGIVAAYLLAGGSASLVYSSALLLIALVVLPAQAIWNTLILLPFIFLLAMGLAGMSASLAALASTHGEFFFAYQQIMQVALLTSSTVFYPIEVMANYFPSFLLGIVEGNPLSLAAQAMRQYTFAGQPVEVLFMLRILATSIPFAAIGAVAYLAVLHRIQVKGKL